MKAIGDMKQGLTSSRPKMSIIPRTAMIYTVRPIEYGAAKYARGNYHGSPPSGVSPAERLLGYLDAAQRHVTRVTDAINRALGTGGDLAAACATVDDDGGGKFPASNLPDLAHALASLAIGVTCAVDDGLLPADPGQPWTTSVAEAAIPQKADPAAEKSRVQRLVLRHGGPYCRSLAELKEAFEAPLLSDDERDTIVRLADDAQEDVTAINRSFGKNEMPGEMVAPLIRGGLAADLCPGESDLIGTHEEV